MKSSLAIAISVFCWVVTATPVFAVEGAPAEYAGAYGQNLVWEGTVVMSADVLILEGARLTIRPGTEVRVVPAEGTQIDPEYLSSQTELLVRGALDIQGTKKQPVRFVVVERPELDDYAWAGITLDGVQKSRIVQARIERADMAIRCVGSSPEIVGNRISACRYGIVAQLESHPEILENEIAGGEGGVYCWRGSRPHLKQNLITGHDEEAVFVDQTSRPRLGRNTIRGNAIGLALYPRDLAYDDVEVTDNHENIRWLGRQGLPEDGS